MSTTLILKLPTSVKRLMVALRNSPKCVALSNQLNSIVSNCVRQSIWQLIALLVTLFVAIAGGLAYLTTSIDKRIEQMEQSSNTRFEMLEKRIDQSERNMTGRLEDLEKNITARFEDLKQEVRAQRK